MEDSSVFHNFLLKNVIYLNDFVSALRYVASELARAPLMLDMATARVEKMHHAGGWCWDVTMTMFDKGRS